MFTKFCGIKLIKAFNLTPLKLVVPTIKLMLQAKTIKFLKGLATNNNREWFDAHKENYLTARTDFEVMVTNLMKMMTPLVPRLEEQQAKDTFFRIYRDVRFSKDKTPYKPHFSAYMSREGRKWDGAGYYLQVSGTTVFTAAGIWMPQGGLLKALRQEIDYGYDELKSIIEQKDFKHYFPDFGNGDQLKKVPAGYNAENPATDLLRMKSLVASHTLTVDKLIGNNAVEELFSIFKTAQPLVDFCNRAFD